MQLYQPLLLYCSGASATDRTYIAITNVNAGPVQVYQTCMLVGTSLQTRLLARCNGKRHGKRSDAIVTDMADGRVQM